MDGVVPYENDRGFIREDEVGSGRVEATMSASVFGSASGADGSL